MVTIDHHVEGSCEVDLDSPGVNVRDAKRSKAGGVTLTVKTSEVQTNLPVD